MNQSYLVFYTLVAVIFVAIITGIYSNSFQKQSSVDIAHINLSPTTIPIASPSINPPVPLIGATCINHAKGFSLVFPASYAFDKKTCDYNPPYNVKMVDDGLSRQYIISVYSEKTQFTAKDWVKSKDICPVTATVPLCSSFIDGPFADSVQFNEVGRHFNSIETVIKSGATVYDISLGSRQASTVVSDAAKQKYLQIVATFKITK